MRKKDSNTKTWLVGFTYEFYQSFTWHSRTEKKENQPHNAMCELDLQFGLLIRTRKLFLLFLLVFNSTQLYKKLVFCDLTVAFIGQFKAKLQLNIKGGAKADLNLLTFTCKLKG